MWLCRTSPQRVWLPSPSLGLWQCPVLRRIPRWLSGIKSACQCRRYRRYEFDPWAWKIPWRRKLQPTPVLFPGESHGQRSLAGYSSWGYKSQTQLSDEAQAQFKKRIWSMAVVLTGVILPPTGYLAISGDIFGCHNWRCCWHLWVETRDAVKHPLVYRAAWQQRSIQLKMPIMLRLRNPG